VTDKSPVVLIKLYHIQDPSEYSSDGTYPSC